MLCNQMESKQTMSAHFAVLREAGLVETEKHGRTILYRLKVSVLEDALLGFAETFGLAVTEAGQEGADPERPSPDPRLKKGWMP